MALIHRQEALDELPPEQRTLLAAWFQEVSQPGVAECRVPWYRLGWRDMMLPWLNTALQQSGRTLTGAVVTVGPGTTAPIPLR